MKQSNEADSAYSSSQLILKGDFIQLELQAEMLREKLARSEMVAADLERREAVSQKAMSILLQILAELPGESKSFVYWGLIRESKSMQSDGKEPRPIQQLRERLKGFAKMLRDEQPNSPASPPTEAVHRHPRTAVGAEETAKFEVEVARTLPMTCQSAKSSSQKEDQPKPLFLSKSSKDNPNADPRELASHFRKPAYLTIDAAFDSTRSEYMLVRKGHSEVRDEAKPRIKRSLLKQFERVRSPLNSQPQELNPFSNSRRKRAEPVEAENLLFESNFSEPFDPDASPVSVRAMKDPMPFSLEFSDQANPIRKSSLHNRLHSITLPPLQLKVQSPQLPKLMVLKKEKSAAGNPALSRNKQSQSSLSETSEIGLKNSRQASSANLSLAFQKGRTALLPLPEENGQDSEKFKKISSHRFSLSQESSGLNKQRMHSTEKRLDSSLDSIPESSSLIHSSQPSSSRFDFNLKKHSKDDIGVFESFHQQKQRPYRTLLPPHQLKQSFLEGFDPKLPFSLPRESRLCFAPSQPLQDRSHETDEHLKSKTSLVTSRPNNFSIAGKFVKVQPAPIKRQTLNVFTKQRGKEAFSMTHSNSLMTPAFTCKEISSSNKFHQASFCTDRNKSLFLNNMKKQPTRFSKKESKSEHLENEPARANEQEPSRAMTKFKREISLMTKAQKEVKKVI